jgi:hypothetical protein
MAEVMALSADELRPSSAPLNDEEDSFTNDDSTVPRTLPSEPEPEPERPLLAAIPKDVDPTKFRLAYGRRAIPKLV